MSKHHYQHFLRLYNRRVYHTLDEVIRLGYPVSVLAESGMFFKQIDWLNKNLKKGSWARSGIIVIFANREDHMHFVIETC